MAIAEAGTPPANATSTGTSVTTASFTPPADSLIVLIAIVGNNSGAGTIIADVSDSADNVWTLLKRSNTDLVNGAGSAEVWAMDAGASPGARTVTVLGTGGANAKGVAACVRFLSGASPVATVLGANVAPSGGNAYTVSITTTTEGSLVVGGLSRITTNVTLVANGTTTVWQSVSDATNTETYGAFRATNLTVTPGGNSHGYTNSASASQVLVAAELKPASAVTHAIAGSGATVTSAVGALVKIPIPETTGPFRMRLSFQRVDFQKGPEVSSALSIAGSGATVTSGSGAVTMTLVFAGTGSTSTTGTGALTRITPIGGTGSTVTTGTGALTRVTPIAGSGSTTTTGSGSVGVRFPIAGTGATSTTGAGSLTRITPIAGSGTTVTTGAGDVTIVTGPVTWSIAGSGTTTTTGAGTVVQLGALTAAGASVTTGAGSLTMIGVIAGTGVTVTVGSGAVSLRGALAGSGLTITTAQGSLTALLTMGGIGITVTTGSGDMIVGVIVPEKSGLLHPSTVAGSSSTADNSARLLSGDSGAGA